MSLQVPTTQESFGSYLSNLESQLGQNSPLNDKAFLRVLAAIEAGGDQGLYKLAIERAKQNLAITATGDDLDTIGAEYGVIRDPGAAAVLTVNLPGTDSTVIPTGTSFIGDANGERYFSDAEATISGGSATFLPGTDSTVIPTGTSFIGDANGERYFSDAEATISGGSATFNVTAENTGSLGNLQVNDTMSISSQIPGSGSTATVTVIDTIGADEETDEEFRPRVLTAVRASTGGGNAFDHKIWAEEVSGVATAFPYAGRPTGTDYPGDRSVYVEADTSIDPDGIAPQALLDDVRESIGTDPDTGLSRPPLGLVDGTLFVESITRTTFYVEVRNLQIDPSVESKTKSEISDAVDLYFRTITPFVDGIDLPQERNDNITDLTVSTVVQDVLSANGGTADGIGFGLSPGTFLPSYLLGEGERAKSGGVTYA
jgi:uncharacterized phage protein gp47/JayE